MNNQTREKKAMTVRAVFLIQLAVIIFTLSSVCSKMTGNHTGSIRLFGFTLAGLSWTGWFWLMMEVLCLGIYAIFWQQIIKRYELSVVYANRAFSVFWSFLWSLLLFHENVRAANIVGIVLVFLGILLVNSDAK